LEAEDWVERTIAVLKRVRAAGAGLRDAHAAINNLAARRPTTCRIAAGADLAALAADLHALNVRLLHRTPRGEFASCWIAELRARHGLSQRDLADRLGIDLRTLQNWEQGRNRPDAAAVSLLRLFDRDPALVLGVVYQPVL
jgi:DNA-binding transcriptional regulator YiaG